jgi:hypothetical protein
MDVVRLTSVVYIPLAYRTSSLQTSLDTCLAAEHLIPDDQTGRRLNHPRVPLIGRRHCAPGHNSGGTAQGAGWSREMTGHEHQPREHERTTAAAVLPNAWRSARYGCVVGSASSAVSGSVRAVKRDEEPQTGGRRGHIGREPEQPRDAQTTASGAVGVGGQKA